MTVKRDLNTMSGKYGMYYYLHYSGFVLSCLTSMKWYYTILKFIWCTVLLSFSFFRSFFISFFLSIFLSFHFFTSLPLLLLIYISLLLYLTLSLILSLSNSSTIFELKDFVETKSRETDYESLKTNCVKVRHLYEYFYESFLLSKYFYFISSPDQYHLYSSPVLIFIPLFEALKLYFLTC